MLSVGDTFLVSTAPYFDTEHLFIIIAVVVAIILLTFLLYALGMMGRIGLIKGTHKAENGAESLPFGEIWSESMPYFWRIFGLNFLIGLAFLIILVPLILFGVITAGIGFVCLLPIFCLLIPVGWILYIVIEQAQAAIVLEDLGILDGIKRGWEIVKTNVMPTIIMSLILGIGGGIFGLIVALPLILAFIPILIGLGTLRESLTPLYFSLACCAVYIPVLIFFNGILTAYIKSAWALTFLRLTKPKDETPVFIEANA